MKLIAHRGLINGPHTHFENQPTTVSSALDQGYDAEVDLWVVDDKLYLGHDAPLYHVNLGFITRPGLWIHAKSLATLHWLVNSDFGLNYFWHENDSYTLTSRGYIWAYPGRALTDRSVMVMPEWEDATLENARTAQCFAVCSDYVSRLK